MGATSKGDQCFRRIGHDTVESRGVGSDSGQRQLEDVRRLFEAACDAARTDLERVEHMLARMDRIEAMLASSGESVKGQPSGPPPAADVTAGDIAATGVAVTEVETADVTVTGVAVTEVATADVATTDSQRPGPATPEAETPSSAARRGGRASLRDSPLAHLFRPTDSRD